LTLPDLLLLTCVERVESHVVYCIAMGETGEVGVIWHGYMANGDTKYPQHLHFDLCICCTFRYCTIVEKVTFGTSLCPLVRVNVENIVFMS